MPALLGKARHTGHRKTAERGLGGKDRRPRTTGAWATGDEPPRTEENCDAKRSDFLGQLH